MFINQLLSPELPN